MNKKDWSQYEVKNPNDRWAQYEINPEEQKKGFQGIGQDIWSGVKKIPESFANIISGLPEEAFGASKMAITNPYRHARNKIVGFAEAGRGAANIPHNILNYLSKKELINPENKSWINKLKAPEFDIREALGLKGKEAGDILLSKSSEIAPYLIAGGQNLLGESLGLGSHAIGQGENPVTSILENAIFSGPAKLAGKAKGKYKAEMEKLTPEAKTKNVLKRLTENEKIQNQKYGEFKEEARGIDLGIPKVPKFGKRQFIRKLKKSDSNAKMILEKGTSDLKYGYKKMLKNPNIDNVHEFIKELGDFKREMGTQGLSIKDKDVVSAAGKMKKSLENSVHNSLKKAGRKDLSDLFKEANEFHNVNVRPYRTKLIRENVIKGKLEGLLPEDFIPSLAKNKKFKKAAGKEHHPELYKNNPYEKFLHAGKNAVAKTVGADKFYNLLKLLGGHHG